MSSAGRGDVDIAPLVASDRLATDGPATHALIIGVSHYRHFEGGSAPTETGIEWGMEQLSAAAASATEVAMWLATEYHNPDAPLGSLRVLVSPQQDEALDPLIGPHVVAASHRATRAHVRAALLAFKRACASDSSNVGFVYIAGHGVQLTKHEATVLLEDIGDEQSNALENAIDVMGCHAGMDYAGAPETQLWFADACRQKPEIAKRFATMKGALTLDELDGSVNVSACFLAASSGESALARRGGRTLFCEALVKCFKSAAVVPPDSRRATEWHVSIHSLSEAVKAEVKALAAAEGEVQSVDPAGRLNNAVVHRLKEPPVVDVVLELRPDEAASVTSAALLLGSKTPVPNVPTAWPVTLQLQAGLYLLQLRSQKPYRDESAILQIGPPRFAFEVDLSV